MSSQNLALLIKEKYKMSAHWKRNTPATSAPIHWICINLWKNHRICITPWSLEAAEPKCLELYAQSSSLPLRSKKIKYFCQVLASLAKDIRTNGIRSSKMSKKRESGTTTSLMACGSQYRSVPNNKTILSSPGCEPLPRNSWVRRRCHRKLCSGKYFCRDLASLPKVP